MQRKIILLPESLWTKIAAGEVVERPSSVVKELVENSIDAGAIEISVSVENGGLGLIKVIDNGCGVSRDDSEFIFCRHATSKIVDEKDLLNIATLGFRGEALPSIASVSRIILRTKLKGSIIGTRIIAEGVKKPLIEDDGCPEGTSIEVKDLFFNTPARLKFMRTAGTEFGKITDAVKAVALAYPGIRFRLSHNGNVSLDTIKGSLLERITDIFGEDISKTLVEVCLFAPGGIAIDGFIAMPEVTYPTSKQVFPFVNRRAISDRGILRAIIAGYSGTMAQARYPFSVINVGTPFDSVDVNVHPAKNEVRFKKPSMIYDVVKASVFEALSKAGKMSVATHTNMPSFKDASFARQASFEAREPVMPYAVRREENSNAIPESLQSPPLWQRGEKGGIEDDFEIIGQLWGEFLAIEKHEEFWVIDQHGAAERARFERLKTLYYNEKGIGSQYLLLPERIETNPEEKETLLRVTPHLKRLGFEMEVFGHSVSKGGETFLLKAVPDMLSGMDNSRLVMELVEELTLFEGSEMVNEKIESVLMR
ncbi:MAG: DNA mismatch repair endonuclease MutL, partial [Thermodesulfobacteriota bacterium]